MVELAINMTNLNTICEHGRTSINKEFCDLEEDLDGEYLSYDVYEVCDYCTESWVIGYTTDRDKEYDKDF